MKILDMCCGSKMFWYEKHEPHTTYMDIRKATYTAKDRGKVRKMQKELNKLLEEQKGDYREEVLLLRLMTIEIKRQVKIQNINTAAAKAIEQLKKEVNNRAWRSRNISLK